ncbi:MAG: acetyltransferase [Desulfobacterium sp.]|nr:acetyltransferase [Desulfobacterium sp.]
MGEKILLVGGGGHCKSCIDVIEEEGTYQIVGIVDLPAKLNQDVLGYAVIGSDADLPELVDSYQHVLITLGQVKSPVRRIQLFEYLKSIGAVFPVIQSPKAYVSRHALVSEGTIVMHHSLINAGAKVGRNCIINTKALVEHDAVIEDHCHIATGAIINGGVKVGAGTFLGSNSVTKECIEIREETVIGCGKKIIKNVPPQSFIF